jgi:hypothetical protein
MAVVIELTDGNDHVKWLHVTRVGPTPTGVMAF